MKNFKEVIKFTPIENLFNEKELKRMIAMVNPRTHECHRNSCFLAYICKSSYPTLEYNEGIIDNVFAHSFNSIVVSGVRHYFDITSYINFKKYNISRNSEGVLLRSYSPNEIFKKFLEDDLYYCTVELDGTVSDYVREMAMETHKQDKSEVG